MEIWRRQILSSKALFDHAEQHRNPSTEINRLLAVEGYHNAVELMLKAVALRKGLHPKKKFFTMDDLLTQLSNKLPPRSVVNTHRSEIDQMSDIRNSAMHSGNVPSPDVVDEIHFLSKQFLVAVATEIFKLTFGELSKADFIEAKNVKRMIDLARGNIDSPKYSYSRIPAKMAFDISFHNYFKLFPTNIVYGSFDVGSAFRIRGLSDLSAEAEQMAKLVDRLNQRIESELGSVRRVLVLSMLGRSMAEIKAFGDINSSFQHLAIAPGGMVEPENTNEEKELSLWYVNFVTEIVLRIEETVRVDAIPSYLQQHYDLIIAKEGRLE
jgi:hypothetical protein